MGAFLKKMLLGLLVLSLAVGQGAMVPALADSMTPVQTVSSAPHSCCPHKDQTPAKGTSLSCVDACLATAHATLPSLDLPKVVYVTFLYPDFHPTPSVGLSLLPDYPPPKV
jgi:hypothetical protein